MKPVTDREVEQSIRRCVEAENFVDRCQRFAYEIKALRADLGVERKAHIASELLVEKLMKALEDAHSRMDGLAIQAKNRAGTWSKPFDSTMRMFEGVLSEGAEKVRQVHTNIHNAQEKK